MALFAIFRLDHPLNVQLAFRTHKDIYLGQCAKKGRLSEHFHSVGVGHMDREDGFDGRRFGIQNTIHNRDHRILNDNFNNQMENSLIS